MRRLKILLISRLPNNYGAKRKRVKNKVERLDFKRRTAVWTEIGDNYGI